MYKLYFDIYHHLNTCINTGNAKQKLNEPFTKNVKNILYFFVVLFIYLCFYYIILLFAEYIYAYIKW